VSAAPPLLIFDLDGTLVDSFADIRRGILEALAAIDVEPNDRLMGWVRRGIGLEQYYCEATGAAPGDPAHAERLRLFIDTYRGCYFRDDVPIVVYEGVSATLERLRAALPDTRLAVATSKRTDMAREVVARGGLTSYFDAVLGSEAIPKKPDPTLLLQVAEAVGVSASEAWMIGDTDKDVLAARAAGCVDVAVTYGGWTRAEMAALEPSHLLDDFADLADLVGI
jgi:phosphoglycolate phosphatase